MIDILFMTANIRLFSKNAKYFFNHLSTGAITAPCSLPPPPSGTPPISWEERDSVPAAPLGELSCSD